MNFYEYYFKASSRSYSSKYWKHVKSGGFFLFFASEFLSMKYERIKSF